MAYRDYLSDDEAGDFDYESYDREEAERAQRAWEMAQTSSQPSIPFPSGSFTTRNTLPPNVVWDTKTQKTRFIKPGEEGYDPTWGSGAEVDPHGTSEKDNWLKSIYKSEGWALPPNGETEKGDENGPGPPPVTAGPPVDSSLPQPQYKYYGTDPYQEWEPDRSYLRDAPQFEFEADPWVEPEAFSYPDYERLPAYQKPEDFSYADFIAPSAEEVLAEDPGYQFRLGEGLRAMEAGAAAKGTLRGGGTLKGLMDYGQSAASQEYQRAYGRRATDYERNRQAAERAYTTNLGAGQTAYELQVGAQQQAYDRQRRNALEQAKLARENAYQAYTDQYNRDYAQAFDRYQPRVETWKEEQRAGEQSARDKFKRQWDAYQYAQPSATTIFSSGI
jgi:hypothetical protein